MVVVAATALLVVWTVVLVGRLVVDVALVDVAAVEAQLKVLRAHMAFPLVLGGKDAVAAVVCEAALELAGASRAGGVLG